MIGELEENIKNKENVRSKLVALLEMHYNGSFVTMVSEYIRNTGMTEHEVEGIFEAIRNLYISETDLQT